MTLELLICTIDDGLKGLEHRLLPFRPDVRYLISWQYTGSQPEIPVWAEKRPDVTLLQLKGRGLSPNRNNALAHATGDIVKVCDDDERWSNEDFDTILGAYRQNPTADILHFQARGLQKTYPPYYVSSVEMTMRLASVKKLRFDERFGLGSSCLNAGEEEVFLCDARQAGLRVQYVAHSICETAGQTTGSHSCPELWRSKGAVFCRTSGSPLPAYCRAVRESLSLAWHNHQNPLPIFRHMAWGIQYIQKWHQ